MIQWIGNSSLFAEDEEELLKYFDQFLAVCKTNVLFIHTEKTSLYRMQVMLFGIIISEECIQLDSRKFDAVRDMNKQTSIWK